MVEAAGIQLRFEALEPVLDEQGRRRFAAAEERVAGRRCQDGHERECPVPAGPTDRGAPTQATVITGEDDEVGAKQGRLASVVLLCHKLMCRVVRWQQGHRGSVRAMAQAIATRTDVMEFAT